MNPEVENQTFSFRASTAPPGTASMVPTNTRFTRSVEVRHFERWITNPSHRKLLIDALDAVYAAEEQHTLSSTGVFHLRQALEASHEAVWSRVGAWLLRMRPRFATAETPEALEP